MKVNSIFTWIVILLTALAFQVNAQEEVKFLHENEINEAAIIDALAPEKSGRTRSFRPMDDQLNPVANQPARRNVDARVRDPTVATPRPWPPAQPATRAWATRTRRGPRATSTLASCFEVTIHWSTSVYFGCLHTSLAFHWARHITHS